MKTKDALLKLKEFLTAERWTQGDYFRSHGFSVEQFDANDSCQFCLQGAIFYLFADDYREVTTVIEEYIGKQYGSRYNIPKINDHFCRKVSDVHAVIEGSIALLEEKAKNANYQG